jgi:2-keto-4-pentenoate hydratase/2-oxohepta-3-ene-1,7-dioic acid hydratase in catechol pathway
MKLLTFRYQGGVGYGVVKDDGVVDISRWSTLRYPTLLEFIASGRAETLASKAIATSSPEFGLDEIDYLPPIPRPSKILCAGINRTVHFPEAGSNVPETPLVFARFLESIVGHEQPILRPLESSTFECEGKLCVVIGKEARRVRKEEALNYVAGYTSFNDGSVQDWQNHASYYTAGNNFFHSGSTGPWIVTKDEIPEPQNLASKFRVNGSLLQDSNTKDMVFGVRELIAYISVFTPLFAGDLIVAGMPADMHHTGKSHTCVEPGDVVEVDIANIGTLRNCVRQE